MSAQPDDPRHTWQWQKIVAYVRATRPWVCHLCGQPIPPHLNGNHPRGPNVDHLTPINQGGDPYDLANVALTHRGCNLSKGDKTSAPPRPETSRDW